MTYSLEELAHQTARNIEGIVANNIGQKEDEITESILKNIPLPDLGININDIKDVGTLQNAVISLDDGRKILFLWRKNGKERIKDNDSGKFSSIKLNKQVEYYLHDISFFRLRVDNINQIIASYSSIDKDLQLWDPEILVVEAKKASNSGFKTLFNKQCYNIVKDMAYIYWGKKNDTSVRQAGQLLVLSRNNYCPGYWIYLDKNIGMCLDNEHICYVGVSWYNGNTEFKYCLNKKDPYEVFHDFYDISKKCFDCKVLRFSPLAIRAGVNVHPTDSFFSRYSGVLFVEGKAGGRGDVNWEEINVEVFREAINSLFEKLVLSAAYNANEVYSNRYRLEDILNGIGERDFNNPNNNNEGPGLDL